MASQLLKFLYKNPKVANKVMKNVSNLPLGDQAIILKKFNNNKFPSKSDYKGLSEQTKNILKSGMGRITAVAIFLSVWFIFAILTFSSGIFGIKIDNNCNKFKPNYDEDTGIADYDRGKLTAGFTLAYSIFLLITLMLVLFFFPLFLFKIPVELIISLTIFGSLFGLLLIILTTAFGINDSNECQEWDFNGPVASYTQEESDKRGDTVRLGCIWLIGISVSAFIGICLYIGIVAFLNKKKILEKVGYTKKN